MPSPTSRASDIEELDPCGNMEAFKTAPDVEVYAQEFESDMLVATASEAALYDVSSERQMDFMEGAWDSKSSGASMKMRLNGMNSKRSSDESAQSPLSMDVHMPPSASPNIPEV